MRAGEWIKLPTTSHWHAAVSEDRIACGSWVSAASIELTQERRPPHKFCCPGCVELIDGRLAGWLRNLRALRRRANR